MRTSGPQRRQPRRVERDTVPGTWETRRSRELSRRPQPTPRRSRAGSAPAAAAVGVWPCLARCVRGASWPGHRRRRARDHAAAAPRRHHPPAGRRQGPRPRADRGGIYEESRFRDQTSHAGARGLMQITPAPPTSSPTTPADTGSSSDLATPQINISYGSYYLRYLLDHYEGNEALAVAAYNAGAANVDRWVAKAGGADAFDAGDTSRSRRRAPTWRTCSSGASEYRDHYAASSGSSQGIHHSVEWVRGDRRRSRRPRRARRAHPAVASAPTGCSIGPSKTRTVRSASSCRRTCTRASKRLGERYRRASMSLPNRSVRACTRGLWRITGCATRTPGSRRRGSGATPAHGGEPDSPLARQGTGLGEISSSLACPPSCPQPA